MSRPSYLPSLLTQECLETLLKLRHVCQTIDRLLIILGAASSHGWRGSQRQLCLSYRRYTGKGISHHTMRRALDDLEACGRLTITPKDGWLAYKLHAARGVAQSATPLAQRATGGWLSEPHSAAGSAKSAAGSAKSVAHTAATCGSGSHTLIEKKGERGILPLSPDLRAEVERATARLAAQAAAPCAWEEADYADRKAELRRQAAALDRAGQTSTAIGDHKRPDHDAATESTGHERGES